MNLSGEKTKDFIAGLIALIFVVTAGYLALNRFNDTSDTTLGTGGEETVLTGETSSDSTMRDDGDVAGTMDGMVMWVANDYEMGDISAGNYTVRDGDTLWEIAEAVYGDGTMWTQILDANSNDVGYLADGSQALIVVGQTLVIPN